MTRAEKLERLIARGTTTQLVDYVINNDQLFKSLIDTYIAGPYRTTQRLADAVTEIAITNAKLIRPHWGTLIKALTHQEATVALKRNTIRMMQFVSIPSTHQGKVWDLCFRFLLDRSETIAVKVFAMSVAEILSRNIRELRQELVIVIEDQLPYSGPAFRSRAAKVLKALRDGGKINAR